ncbi:integrase, partial [Listeria monocytogenes]|nr:integrase [Listeria monocytogenes]
MTLINFICNNFHLNSFRSFQEVVCCVIPIVFAIPTFQVYFFNHLAFINSRKYEALAFTRKDVDLNNKRLYANKTLSHGEICSHFSKHNLNKS